MPRSEKLAVVLGRSLRFFSELPLSGSCVHCTLSFLPELLIENSRADLEPETKS